MFRSKVTKKNVVNADGATVVANRINNGCVVTGRLTSDTDFRIDGKIYGDIDCNAKVVIGATGEVHGDIRCTDLTIEGSVTGNVYASGTLYFRKSCFFGGREVHFVKLIVEEGADIKATLIPIEEQTQEQADGSTEEKEYAE